VTYADIFPYREYLSNAGFVDVTVTVNGVLYDAGSGTIVIAHVSLFTSDPMYFPLSYVHHVLNDVQLRITGCACVLIETPYEYSFAVQNNLSHLKLTKSDLQSSR
jgi:hypothetical protein